MILFLASKKDVNTARHEYTFAKAITSLELNCNSSELTHDVQLQIEEDQKKILFHLCGFSLLDFGWEQMSWVGRRLRLFIFAPRNMILAEHGFNGQSS